MGTVIFIDTSAIVAVLCNEPVGERLVSRIEGAPERITAAHVRLESVMVLARRLDLEASKASLAFDAFVAEAKVNVMVIDDAVARLAVEAFTRFGKGTGSKAQLNFGDCLSYAAARAANAAMLFVGEDFRHTDIAMA